ncbi:MAG TPA: hypothetical protein VJ552_05280 [Sediminibacterium sp.]|nr:hypothetical protein [Sediminibacterium sp.]
MEHAINKLIIDRLDKIEEIGLKTFEQATKTNGRVTALEDNQKVLFKNVNTLKQESAETRGRDKVIWIVLCCGGVVVGWVINSLLK